MREVTLSQHYQISIPQEIRDLLNLQVGQKFSVVLKNDSITLVPQSSIQSFRGVLKGANTHNVRDRSERV
ncbi:AbrB/MazE/SpoVT family DNA-binding domain-containing protein [Pseudanabaena sp. BC1403]|uniref:AbrB/MazE/SpoVT family DNA-binding domain-containing protein n=1 Tax=Pseudanabaena sp. BC1403 TaxID=2043171 RepID=UPI000CD88F66|nr:AbrB/MazE/SpoVT family DNA-binding domain-containing protein [Pseudanabaena sp. BC1403]